MYKIISGILIILLGLEAFSIPSSNILPKEDVLCKISSEKELEKIIENNIKQNYYFGDYAITADLAQNSVVNESAEPSSSKGDSAYNDYSETNVQVSGVDEADIVKTNGDYIYYLANGNLYIIKVSKAGKMNIEKTIKINNNYYYPNEMYIDDNYITVVGNEYKSIKNDKDTSDSLKNRYYETSFSTVKIYDINSYELVRSFEIIGNYVSSRKINDDIYIISNHYIYNKYSEILPLYIDTAISNDINYIEATDIYYFKNFEECNYMIISSLSLDNLDKEADIQTYLGAGNQIYASTDNLYVAKVEYQNNLTTNSVIKRTDDFKQSTKIHKFKIKDGNVEYIASGTVDGALLNQFSMDEYNGYFRITTTCNINWDESTNNMFVLDGKMNVVGSVEGLAKGEKIYSTRFMGDKCYVVTYKTVDPLFVIDLSNPRAPKVLGELKIPGYSEYLHPLGENYLIGFGHDSVEKSYINWDGDAEVTAYNMGLKLAIFDVSDLSNPKELYSVKIGGRGSLSELSDNHKALLFNEEKGIFAFPATIYKDGGFYDNGVPRYGEVDFEGALVFDLSVENGIKLRGKVTNNDKSYGDIERLIYINDILYTLSNEMIKASDLDTLEEISSIKLEKSDVRDIGLMID